MSSRISGLRDIVHFKSRKDLPRLGTVVLLLVGIVVGVSLALQPQLFNKRADEGSVIDLKFIPELIQAETGKTYEAKIAINPKGERVTSVKLHVSYDPQSIAVLATKNLGFLPIELKKEDDHSGNLLLIYGSTIDNQSTQPGMLAAIQFKVLNPFTSMLKVDTESEISISSKEGNVLNVYPFVTIEPVDSAPAGEAQYPDNLLLEKAFFASSEPAIQEFKEILTPKPQLKKERIKPELSMDYAAQLGGDIFVSPIVALNQVLEEGVGGVFGR
jgi:hypothetical protein